MNLFVLGSCRVHRPIMALAAAKKCTYSFGAFGGEPPYTHTPAEHLQFLRVLSGELEIPLKLRPFVFLDPAYVIPRGFAEMMENADAIVVELCSLNEYAAGPFALNFSRTSRMLISSAGLRNFPLMTAVAKGIPPPPGAVDQALNTIRDRQISIDDAGEWLLHSLWSRHLKAFDFKRFFWELDERFAKPIIAVSHIVPTHADPRQIKSRTDLRNEIELACGGKTSFYDPTRRLARYPQPDLFARGGIDTAHYANDKLLAIGDDLLDFITSDSKVQSRIPRRATISLSQSLEARLTAFEAALQPLAKAILADDNQAPKHWRRQATHNVFSPIQLAIIESLDLSLEPASRLVHANFWFPSLSLFLAHSGYEVLHIEPRKDSAELMMSFVTELSQKNLINPANIKVIVRGHFQKLDKIGTDILDDAILIGPGPLCYRSEIDEPAHKIFLSRFGRLIVDPATLFGDTRSLSAEKTVRALLQESGFQQPDLVRTSSAPYALWSFKRQSPASRPFGRDLGGGYEQRIA